MKDAGWKVVQARSVDTSRAETITMAKGADGVDAVTTGDTVVTRVCAGGIDNTGISDASRHFASVAGLDAAVLEGELVCILRLQKQRLQKNSLPQRYRPRVPLLFSNHVLVLGSWNVAKGSQRRLDMMIKGLVTDHSAIMEG